MKARAIQSGWCNSGHHGKCSFELQTATEKRRRITCSCPCHPKGTIPADDTPTEMDGTRNRLW